MHKNLVVLCSEYYHWPLVRFPFSDHNSVGKPRTKFSGNKRLFRCKGESRDIDMGGISRDRDDKCRNESEGIANEQC